MKQNLLSSLKFFITMMCMVSLHATLAGRAEAAPVQFGQNLYEFVLVSSPYEGSNNTWLAAQAMANQMNGHLAVIDSQAENAFLLDLVSGSYSYSAFTGAWIGQPISYSNWGGSEPNNGGVYAYMNISTQNFAGIAPGTWADSENGVPVNIWDPVVGFFVEYEGTPPANPVPEPSTMLLLGSGLVGLVGSKFRRRTKN